MIRYRKLEKDDLDFIEELWLELQDYHRSVNENSSDVPFSVRMGILKKKDFIIFSAWSQNRIVGYCIPSIDNENSGVIESIYVKGHFRYKGIGSMLLKKSLAWFKKNSIERVHIGVVYGNTKVFPFYEKFGFRPQAYILRN